MRKVVLPMTKVKKLRHNEYYDLQETFDKLYADSQKGKIFNNLMEIIASPENIQLAYRNIKKNSGSNTKGVDNRTIKDVESLTSDEYIELVQRKLAYYKPKPVRRVEIPKPNGKTRPLGIPTITDRLVQQCVLQVLEPICEAKFHERSNGFRPNRSAEQAMAQCYKMIQQQNLHFVVDIDIKGFFDNVNHNKLINQMWAMGIRDKQLICIIKTMLKAAVIMPNGEKIYPECGTPQGGILSPLLSNIVLNELDWWISSQWETIPTHRKYAETVNKNGTIEKKCTYRALRKSNLKEIYIVRYADDFKIFCRKRNDADKTFKAVKLWLQDRLKLQISEDKSKVVNLKRHYSEFLGFKLKAVKKSNRYVVRSHMSDKAVRREKEKLCSQIKNIQNPKDSNRLNLEIEKYNQMVEGIHNYYKCATHISIDCGKMQRSVSTMIGNRLKGGIKRKGTLENKHIKERYGKSQQLRFVNDRPLIPVGYIQTKNPMYKKKSICKYTVSGREEIHKNLKFDEYVLMVMKHMIYNYERTDSIEFVDNKISLYAGQYGRCAILGTVLNEEDIHCHHKLPKQFGGKDNYQNLIIIHKDLHKLIHATRADTINKYLHMFNLNSKQLKKVNELRELANTAKI